MVLKYYPQQYIFDTAENFVKNLQALVFEKNLPDGGMYFERRRCNFTSRDICAKDRASVQILLAKLDSNGRMTEEVDIVDICGDIRAYAQCDSLLYEYSKQN